MYVVITGRTVEASDPVKIDQKNLIVSGAEDTSEVMLAIEGFDKPILVNRHQLINAINLFPVRRGT